MKRNVVNKITLSSLIFAAMICLLQGFSFAQSENIQMIKKNNEEYIIYIDELLNEDFQFAFSDTSSKSSLAFYDSAMDQAENGNHIAYIDSDIYNNILKDKDKIYLWIKQGDIYLVEAQEINLDDALSEEDIEFLNNSTKSISVEIGNKKLPTKFIDEVEQNVEIGTINIIDNKNEKYYYQIVKIVEDTDVERFVELSEEINNIESKNTFEKLCVYSEFKNIYSKIAPNLDEKDWWLEVNDYTIEQPTESKKGEKYIVWIKDSSKIDFQIMTCDNDYIPEYQDREFISLEVTKLPVTGASISLFIVLAIVVISIIAVIMIKKKNKNEK